MQILNYNQLNLSNLTNSPKPRPFIRFLIKIKMISTVILLKKKIFAHNMGEKEQSIQNKIKLMLNQLL